MSSRGSFRPVAASSARKDVPTPTGVVKAVSMVPPPVSETRKPRRQFDLPPLSTFRKDVEPKPEVQAQQKRKILRKIIPPNEDIPKLKDVVRSLKGEDIGVQEYVGLVAPFTGDNAHLLREIMANELCAFRTMANKIYNTMTQDVSDVLTNEHVQLIEFQNEQITLYQQRMMRAIDTIHAYAKDFNFQAYHEHPEEYLKSLFPVHVFSDLDEEQQELLLRQQAFHRLQWLKTEGERLAEENDKLLSRLNELKAITREEKERRAAMDRQAEMQRAELEAEQDDLKEQLMGMQTEVQRSIVEGEQLDSAKGKMVGPAPAKVAAERKTPKKTDFAIKAATELEIAAKEDLKEASLSAQSIAVPEPRGAVPKKPSGARTKQRQRPTWQDVDVAVQEPSYAAPQKETSPFHYSPPKTPPRHQRQRAAAAAAAPPPPRQVSPFHYSPPRASPPPPQQQQQRSPFHYSPGTPSTAAPPPQLTTPPRRRVERTTTVIEPLPGAMRRRGQAPRDSWGGFY